MVICAKTPQFWPEEWFVFPSVSDCGQGHSHAGKEDTHTLREKILYPLWEEEPGTGVALQGARGLCQHLYLCVMDCVGFMGVGEAGENEGRGLLGREGFLTAHAECPSAKLSEPRLLALQYILSVDRANLNKELLTGRLSLLFANSSNTHFAGDLGFAP